MSWHGSYTMIQAIWRYESFAVFKNVLIMLSTTLILNLLVDSASRIGELLSTDAEPQHKVAGV